MPAPPPIFEGSYIMKRIICYTDHDLLEDPDSKTYCGKRCDEIPEGERAWDINMLPSDFDETFQDSPCKKCLNTPEGQMKLLATFG